MLEVFSILSKLLRVRYIHIDGFVFRLHCTLTVLILLVFCLVNSSKQIAGEPIACDADKDIVSIKALNSFCYINAIFLRGRQDIQDEKDISGVGTVVGTGVVIYPGIGPSKRRDLEEKQSYYQWVWFVLLLQAVSFYFPRWLWKLCESNKISSLSSDLSFFQTDDKSGSQLMFKKIELIVEYLYRTRGTNDWYAIKYFFCELLSYLNVVLQFLIIDWFLSGRFLTLGFDWINWNVLSDPNDPIDPMHRVFPLMSKCYFPRYGASGSREALDALCVLSINVFNQKIYLFLWFWFSFLVIITSLVIICRLLLICCPTMRYYVCRYRFDITNKFRNRNKHLISKELLIGDWFILYLLGQNIEPIIFGEILERLCQKLNVRATEFSETMSLDQIETNDIPNDTNIFNESTKM